MCKYTVLIIGWVYGPLRRCLTGNIRPRLMCKYTTAHTGMEWGKGEGVVYVCWVLEWLPEVKVECCLARTYLNNIQLNYAPTDECSEGWEK